MKSMNSETIRVEGDFPVYFRYTVGIAAERFFREIKDNGKLVASRCPKCDLNYLPPRIYCERCMSQLKEYLPIENLGKVAAFTSCVSDAEGNVLPEPVGVAFVEFPSAHGGLVHRTKGKVSIGDKVRIVFKEKAKRTGSILDIEHFEKVT
jgi:uncharacterized OB-fold protein